MCRGMRSQDLQFQRRRIDRRFANLLLAASIAAVAAAGPRFAQADSSAKAPAKAAPAAGQPAVGENIPAWIQQLGDDHFEVREEASRHLSQMGIEIQPALEIALRDSDMEIRVRARRILDSILKADLERRLTAFAADVNDTKHYDLPGWSRYREVVGSTGQARHLFVEMQRAEPNLFRAMEDGPAAAGTALENCITNELIHMQFRARMAGGNAIPLGSVTALLFVGSDKQVTIADDLAIQLAFLTNQPSIQQALNGGSQVAILKKILGAWISHDANVNVLQQNLWLAMRFDLKEGIEPASKALRQANQQPQIKQVSLVLIGKLGDKTNLPVVESCLQDTDLCGQMMMNNQQFQTQVRDVALAIAIHLHGQDPKAFGFDRFDLTNGMPYYNPGMIGFRNDTDRIAATKKWADWVAAHHLTTDASTAAKKS